MSVLLGCIADDFTGATDLANTLTRGGLRTVQVNGVPRAGLSPGDADAVVVAVSVDVAVIVRSCASTSCEPSGRPAVVVSQTRLSAIEAPMPVVSPSADCFARAVAVFSTFDVAVSSTFAPLTSTGSVPSTIADVS